MEPSLALSSFSSNLPIPEGDDASIPTAGVVQQGQMNNLPVAQVPTEKTHLYPSRTLLTDESKAHVLTGADHVILSTAKGDHSASISIESFRKAASTCTETLPLIIVEKEGGRSIQARKSELNVSNGKTQAENRNILKTLKAAIVSKYSQAKADSIDELQPLALLKEHPLTGGKLRKIFETLDGNKTESLTAMKPLPTLKLKGGGAGASTQNNINFQTSLSISEIFASVDSVKEVALQVATHAFEQWCELESTQAYVIFSLENQRNIFCDASFATKGVQGRVELQFGRTMLEHLKNQIKEDRCTHPIARKFLNSSHHAYQLAKELIKVTMNDITIDPSDALRAMNIAIEAFTNTWEFVHSNETLEEIKDGAVELENRARNINGALSGGEAILVARAAERQWKGFLEKSNKILNEIQAAQDRWPSELLPPQDHDV